MPENHSITNLLFPSFTATLFGVILFWIDRTTTIYSRLHSWYNDTRARLNLLLEHKHFLNITGIMLKDLMFVVSILS